MGLLCLFLITILFAVGALIIKYKLESFRTQVQEEAQRRMGSGLQLGNVMVNGLRGLRIDNLDVELPARGGPRCRVQAPSAYIYIDIADLLYGQMTLDRVQVDDSTITVEADRTAMISEHGVARWADDELLRLPAFRATGRDCTLLLKQPGESIEIRDFFFDVSRMTDSPDLSAHVTGTLGGKAANQVDVRVRYSSPTDFDARVFFAALGTDDVARFVPGVKRAVQSGAFSPSLRVSGYSNDTWVVSCDAPFEEVRLMNQPEFVTPLSGTLTALGSYDRAAHTFRVVAAQIDADQLRGTLSGQVVMGSESPQLDLQFRAEQWPVTEIVNLLVQQRLQEHGALDVVFEDSNDLVLTLQGPLSQPSIHGTGDVARGRITFQPKDSTYPKADLAFSRLHVAWDAQTKAMAGSLTVEDGTITHAKSGLTFEKVACALSFDQQQVRVEPLSARLRDSMVSGAMAYDYQAHEGELALNGTVPSLETLPLKTFFKDATLTGSAHVELTGTRKGGQYVIDASLDAGQAGIAYEWWFDKPAGVGAAARVKTTLVPRKRMTIEVGGEVAETKLTGTVAMTYAASAERKWRATKITATSPSLDVVTVGKCLRLPYRFSGGKGRDATYSWERLDSGDKHWRMRANGVIDAIDLLPDGGAIPIRLKDAVVGVDLNRTDNSTGTLTVEVSNAAMPAFGNLWFIPLRTDPALLEKYPPTPRAWTYDLKAAELTLPPWIGSGFNGTAYTNDAGGGLTRYAATVEGGEIEGSYKSHRASNTYESDVTFRSVPIKYFLEHLKYPPILTGVSTGKVTWGLDRDDPDTLQGTGLFDVRGGNVDTQFFFSQLEGNAGNVPALPPALPFDLVHAEIEFHRDMVKTPQVQLLSPGLSLNASGSFVRGGDMNYDLKLAISPETAQRIPVLRESFNIEGHRISQKDLELAFVVTGPTFNPRGEISGLPPARVTFVSGALGITSEAVKLIDTPRRILVDLLKMGGGMLGAQGRNESGK